MRAFTLEDLRTACAVPCSVAGPWALLIQKLVWQYGEAGALERMNGQMARAA